MRRLRPYITAVALGILAGLVLPPARAFAANYRMYNWMQPPVHTGSNKACLTQGWHPDLEGNGRALDWKKTCGTKVSDTVYFRSRTAAPDDAAGFQFIGAWGEPSQQPDQSCGSGTVWYAWVKIRATINSELEGVATYQHMKISSTTRFDIWFTGGTSFSTGRLNVVSIGSTQSDADTKSNNCWSGWHVHENDHGTAKWDLHNTAKYNSPSLECQCYQVDHKDNWTRRLYWNDVF